MNEWVGAIWTTVVEKRGGGRVDGAMFDGLPMRLCLDKRWAEKYGIGWLVFHSGIAMFTDDFEARC